MKACDIETAMDEAERFVDRARKALAEHAGDAFGLAAGSKATGALRRASLDLTRALADLRRAE